MAWLVVVGMAGLIIGCAGASAQSGGQRSTRIPTVPAQVQNAPPSDSRPAPQPSPPIGQRIRMAVNEWQGTPHRLGGTGRNGIDCSGFVQRIYQDLFGRAIPRTTGRQVQHGIPVNQRQLAPGDLVFFRPPQKAGHVGIYLGEKEFAHASTSQGVTISRLDEPYWRGCYWTARRYLD